MGAQSRVPASSGWIRECIPEKVKLKGVSQM